MIYYDTEFRRRYCEDHVAQLRRQYGHPRADRQVGTRAVRASARAHRLRPLRTPRAA